MKYSGQQRHMPLQIYSVLFVYKGNALIIKLTIDSGSADISTFCGLSEWQALLPADVKKFKIIHYSHKKWT